MTKRKTKFKKMEGEERYTSTEMPVSQLESRAQEANSKHDKQMKIIEQSIGYLHELKNLEQESFYCIHVNWHCVTTQSDRTDELNKVKVFYPAQIAVVEFNLKQGLLRRFNKFINVAIPKGYASETRERKEKVHHIPLAFEQGESNLAIVYKELKSFLTHGHPSGSIPPLYTRGDDVVNNTSITAVCSVLKSLYYHVHIGASIAEAAMCGDDWESEFKVYPLSKLTFELGKLYNPTQMVDVSIADYILEKDPYMYQAGIATKFLEDLDATQNCSLSMVSRWTMVIREFCNPDLVSKEKLAIPPVESSSNPSGTTSKTVTQQSQPEHERLYPAMKAKEASPKVVFVHNPSSAPPTNQHTPAPVPTSSVAAGSAWAKPLVYQPPGSSYSGAGSSGSSQNGATDNFPPLGGLHISNQESPRNQTRRKK